MRTFVKRLIAAFSLVIATTVSAAADVRLVMIEEHGCFWCARWLSEIGPIYPKSSEGRIAPLQRVEIGSAEMNALELTSTPAYTPTFILVDDGVEVGRLEGYPGEDFFWFLIGQVIEKLPPEKRIDPAS